MPTPTVTLQSCYKMKSFLVNLILILGFTTTLRGGEIKVLLNPENQNVSDALVVVFPKKVKVKKGQTTLDYKVLNRSSEDIFMVIESKNTVGWDELKSPSGMMVSGGRFVSPESTHEILRLLWAPARDSDGTLSHGVAEMSSRAVVKVNVETGHDRDLSNWIGGTGTLSLQIKYYVGSSKGRHMATVAVPLEIQAAESDQGK
jgi:hypothetical protein